MTRSATGSFALPLLAIAFLFTASAKAQPPDKPPKRVLVCHVDSDDTPVQIKVTPVAAAGHFRDHPYDSPGDCDNNCALGQECDDGNECTQNICGEDNACDFSQPVECPDDDLCLSYGCDPAQGCVINTAEHDGEACEETGKPPGACQDGECVGGALPVFDCTEQGILAAIAGGAGQLDCEGATTVTTTAPIEIVKDVILDGVDNLVVQGDGTDTIFVVPPNVTADLRRMTITGGGGVDFGGGLINQGTLKLTHCGISGNTATAAGGGVYNTGTLTITSTHVSGNSPNSADYGGGIFNSGEMTIEGSTIGGGFANISGGGIYNEGQLLLIDSSVSGNLACEEGGGIYSSGAVTSERAQVNYNSAGGCELGGAAGGGIYVAQATVALTDTVIQSNLADYGGGIVNDEGALTVTGTTIFRNRTEGGFAGGIANDGGSLSLVNSTVSENEAEWGAGILNSGTLTVNHSTFFGHYDAAIFNYAGTATLKNTLLAGPTGPGGSCVNYASLTSAGHNIEGSGNTCNLTEASDQFNVPDTELKLRDFAANLDLTPTFALLEGSVAIDQASCLDTSGQAVATDQRGVARPQGSGCDVGAVEFIPAFPCTEQGIRDAITAGGGPHLFACDGPTTITTGAEIAIGNNVILDGGRNLIVDGGNDHRVFSVPSGVTAELRGMTVSGGYARWGAGITNRGDLTLTDTTVTKNTQWQFYYANTGGGIANYGTLQLRDSTVSQNTAASFGGGISNVIGAASDPEPVLTLNRSMVLRNTAFAGGGIFNSQGAVTLNSSQAAGNRATLGGAIYTFEGTVTLTGSIVRYNRADFTPCQTNPSLCTYPFAIGGGLFVDRGNVELLRTEISDNRAVPIGIAAGIAVGTTTAAESRLTATNSTISNNVALGDGTPCAEACEGCGEVCAGAGAGIGSYGVGATSVLSHVTLADNNGFSGSAIYNTGTVSIGNSLIKGDCDGLGIVESRSNNIESPGDTCGLVPGADQVGISEPLLGLGPLENNGGLTRTHALLDGSVAINQIIPDDCVDANDETVRLDQRLIWRPQQDSCDVGAVESECGVCDDNNVCTTDWCDASGGQCSATPIADFSGQCRDYNYVSGMCIGGVCTDLRGANLYGANLTGVDLSGLDLSGADLRSATLDSANLVATNISGALLAGASLVAADLSGANLHDAGLKQANLTGANLFGADLSGAYMWWAQLGGADLTNANLDGATLNYVDLRSVTYTGASFVNATYRKAEGTTNDDYFPSGFNPYLEGMIDQTDYVCDECSGTWGRTYECNCRPAAFDCRYDACPIGKFCPATDPRWDWNDPYYYRSCQPDDCRFKGCGSWGYCKQFSDYYACVEYP